MLGGRGAASSFREGSHVVVVVVVVDDDDHPEDVDAFPTPRRRRILRLGRRRRGARVAVVARRRRRRRRRRRPLRRPRRPAEETGRRMSPPRGGDGDGDVADPAPGEDRVHRRVVVRALAVLPQRGRDVRLHRIRPVQRELLHVRVPRFSRSIERRPARERWARARTRRRARGTSRRPRARRRRRGDPDAPRRRLAGDILARSRPGAPARRVSRRCPLFCAKTRLRKSDLRELDR